MRDRFMSKIQVQDNGCWAWAGRITKRGYGHFSVKRKMLLAHRVAYEMFIDHVPEGYVVDHVCHNADPLCAGGSSCEHRRCVNPIHLHATSQRSNVLSGRGIAARYAARLKCKNGHDLANGNVRMEGNTRVCKACQNAASKRYYARSIA